MTYIPLVNSGTLGSISPNTVTLYNVFMPYSHDITTYYMFITDKDGEGKNYFEEENLG